MTQLKLECPHCGQHLEASDDLFGETVECPSCQGSIEVPYPRNAEPGRESETQATSAEVQKSSEGQRNSKQCPYCGESILATARKCRYCGEFLKGRSNEVSTNVKQGALIGALVCFGLGIGLMVLSLWSFIIYGPLFLVAFVLSIVAMAQRRVFGGLVMLLLTLIVPPGLFLGLAATRGSEVAESISSSIEEQENARVKALEQCSIEETEGYIDGNYMYFKGKVRNNGDTEVKSVEVKVEWLDNADNVLDTDRTYAVGPGAELRPGGAKSFKIMTPADNRMESYRYWIKK